MSTRRRSTTGDQLLWFFLLRFFLWRAWVNQAFTDETGYTAADAIGKNARILKSGVHDRAFFTDLWNTILARASWRGELTDRKKDGGLLVQDVSITPVKDARGEVVRLISISRDLTEAKQLEAEFRQAQKMESVGQLAGGIAHDFNNLLTIINWMAALLLEPLEAGDPRRADLEEISHAGERHGDDPSRGGRGRASPSCQAHARVGWGYRGGRNCPSGGREDAGTGRLTPCRCFTVQEHNMVHRHSP